MNRIKLKNYKTRDDFLKGIGSRNNIRPHRDALRISLTYGVFGVLWILFSSEIVHTITDNMTVMKELELIKGWFYVLITVTMIYILIKKHLQMLQVSEQRYKLALEGPKDGVWEWNSENNLVYFSHTGNDQSSNKERWITLNDWKGMIYPEDKEKAIDTFEKYLDAGKGTYKDTYRIREENGEYFFMFIRGQAIWDKDGKITRIVGFYTDITEQVKLQKTLQEVKELSDNIFDNAPIIIAISDLQGRVIKCNKHTTEVLGYTYEDLKGVNWIEKLIPIEKKKDMEQLLENHQNEQLVTNFEEDLICKNGRHLNILWSNAFLYNEDRSIKSILSMGVDITAQKNIEKNLQHMVYYNSLTKLPNRLWFEKESDKIVQNALVSNEKMALIYLDIDNFKYVNDIAGYNFGDKILMYISNIIKHQIKQSDIIVQLVGDEFVILFHNILNMQDVISRAENLQQFLNRPWRFEKEELFITSSMGIAVYPEHGQDLITLLKNAETAMYSSKSAGKARYSFYNEVTAKKVLEYNWMVSELRRAIQKEEFQLYYQPIVSLHTEKLIGVEVLIRWKHSIRGFISPAEFIPVAESSGLIMDIGKWIFDRACEQKKIWNDKGYSDIKMSINLSGRELADKKLFSNIKQSVESNGLESSNIQIEITETAAMVDLDASMKTINQLKTLGLKVALDDFGTGYSSLNYLKTLPIDVIKLDGSFVKSIQDENQKEEIVTTVIQLSHILNLQVVAEGVETREQMIFLRNNNCDFGQGYLFSKPLSAEEVELLLESK
ncbi:EAL domain-containing protein [Clostridium chromiireducens]|uniref:EAL domain-containing protein n=1 Tax=Clostridium chromiireducens TaxID=225345 RepID=A0A964RT12_9CLOT|nr:GGDEF and EAL domain-containing protein [Clostridium chromiireducens]MVX67245.1 EAL domain-containing protein [Clostridium chromiireducens]